MRVAKLEKRNAQLQEDQDGIAIALDAKQVEIQLLKRQLRDSGLTSAIGLTPAIRKTARKGVATATPFKPPVEETPLARHGTLHAIQMSAVATTIKKPTTKPRRISFGIQTNRDVSKPKQTAPPLEKTTKKVRPNHIRRSSASTLVDAQTDTPMDVSAKALSTLESLPKAPTSAEWDGISEASSDYETAAYA